MFDLVMLALLAAGFAAIAGFAHICDRLTRRAAAEPSTRI